MHPQPCCSHPLATAPHQEGTDCAMPRAAGKGREGNCVLSQQQESKHKQEAGSNKPQVKAVPRKLVPAEVGWGPWGLAAPFAVEKQSRAMETNPNKFTTCLIASSIALHEKVTACSMFVFHHMTPGIQRCHRLSPSYGRTLCLSQCPKVTHTDTLPQLCPFPS